MNFCISGGALKKYLFLFRFLQLRKWYLLRNLFHSKESLVFIFQGIYILFLFKDKIVLSKGSCCVGFIYIKFKVFLMKGYPRGQRILIVN